MRINFILLPGWRARSLTVWPVNATEDHLTILHNSAYKGLEILNKR